MDNDDDDDDEVNNDDDDDEIKNDDDDDFSQGRPLPLCPSCCLCWPRHLLPHQELLLLILI